MSLIPNSEITHCISLTQPFATLMAIVAKVNETRSWPTQYRGWIAIHAAKGFPGECKRLVYEPLFCAALANAGYEGHKELPLGIVLAVTQIVDCRHTESVRDGLSEYEHAFGDYSDGRYAFITSGLRRLRRPFLIRGALGIWTLPLPINESDLL